MLKLLLLAGIVMGGYFAYKRFTQQPDDDWDTWPVDPQPGTADIYQGTDPPAL